MLSLYPGEKMFKDLHFFLSPHSPTRSVTWKIRYDEEEQRGASRAQVVSSESVRVMGGEGREADERGEIDEVTGKKMGRREGV